MSENGPKNAPDPSDVPFGAPVPNSPCGLPEPPKFPNLSGFDPNPPPADYIIRLTVTGGRVWVRGNTFQFKDLLKSILGASWEPRAKSWTYPANASSAAALHTLFPQARTDDAFRELLKLQKVAEKAQQAKTATADELANFDTRTKPWLHQKQAFHFALGKVVSGGGVMLAMDMGTGKSKVTIDLLNNIDFGYPEGVTSYLATIVCPKAVISHWPSEFAKHSIHPAQVITLNQGAVKDRVKLARELLDEREWHLREGASPDPLVFVMNYEAIIRKQMKEFLYGHNWDAVICDEIHRIKKPGGVQSMTLMRLRDLAKVRIGLSGTPMPRGPEDLYAQCRFLDPSVYGTSNARFRAKYLMMGGFENRQVVGYTNKAEFESKFDSIAFRVDADDVLDLPDQKHVKIRFDLTPAERRPYDRMEKDLIAEINGGLVTAANALTKLLRLQQIVQGWVPDVDGSLQQVGTTKEDVLHDHIMDIPSDEPIAVVCQFYSDLDSVARIASKLERTCFESSGRKQGDGLDEWQQSEGGEVIAVQVQSGSEGIDLTRTKYMYFFCGTYQYGKYLQVVKRIHRPGQTRPVTYFHLLARNTVDEKVFRSYSTKGNLIDGVLSGLTKGGRNVS